MNYKKRLAVVFIVVSYLCAVLFFTAAYAQTTDKTLSVMPVDYETRLYWQQLSLSAPEFRWDRMLERNFASSLSLLDHINYNPVERDQGMCGNCWAWAGTGAMEIALDLQESIYDRLSVQFINSCNAAKLNCEGGWLADVADFYTGQGFTIPWSNTNAHWQSGDGSSVPCGIIEKTPSRGILSIGEQQVITHGVGQETAIANIKAALNENKPVWFGFFMSTNENWNAFFDFWLNQGETTVWDGFFHGIPCGSECAGHAVLIVGYNDDDPGNRYWVALNSWGTTAGRPNGLFRISMDLNYDGTSSPGLYNLFFQTLDVSYDSGLPAPVLNAEPPTTPGTSNTVSWAPGVSENLPRYTGEKTPGLTSENANGKSGKKMNPSMPPGPISNFGNLETASSGVYARLTADRFVTNRSEDLKPRLPGPRLPRPRLPMPPPGDTVSVFNETFEGIFPGANWTLYGDPTWDDTSYDAYEGTWSGWCADSGVSPESGYPNNMNAWMVYGPFSLADATSAQVSFFYKNTSELNFDYFQWFASINGNDFYGYGTSGTQAAWTEQIFDLTAVPTLGNLSGQSEVWFALRFVSDSSIAGLPGAFVDDIVIQKDTAQSLADLAPYTPASWNYPIPIGNTQLMGTDAHSYDGPFYSDETLYFNWSSINQGASATGPYRVHLEVTGTGGGSWDLDPPYNDVGFYWYWTNDQPVGPLSAGNHTFRMWVDYLDDVAEENEDNNYYERTIFVLDPTLPDLTPYTPAVWNYPIPIGKTQLAGSDVHSYGGPFYDDEVLYFNWSSINQGAVAASAYRVHVELTGSGGGSWDYDLPDNVVGGYWYLTNDQAVGPLSAGTHTFKIWVDYLDAVVEGNENNNYYERTIDVLTIEPPAYYAECSDNPEFSAPQNSDWITDTEFTFTGLTGGTTYWYRVKARQGAEESPWSNVEFSQQEPPALNPPALSSPSDGEINQPTDATLHWIDTNASPQETGYRVRIRSSGGSYSYFEVAQDSTSYAPALTYGTTYYWNVQAMGNGGSTSDSGWANSGIDWSFVTSDDATIVLNAPILIAPADGASNQPISVALQWSDTNSSPQESGYRVRIKPSGGNYSNYTTAQDGTLYTAALLPETTYYWNVQAMGDGVSTSDSAWANAGTDWSLTTMSLACSATRILPGYAPGQSVEVTIDAAPPAATSNYAVQDAPPVGWTVGTIDNGGAYDSVNNLVKWGPFFDNVARSLHYSITAPPGASGDISWGPGIISIDGYDSAICGDQIISENVCHPADTNCDMRLAIGEITAYGAAWKTGATWVNPPNPIPISYVTNAGYIWKAGEVYYYDPAQTPPACWVPGVGGSQFALAEEERFSPHAEWIQLQNGTGDSDLTASLLSHDLDTRGIIFQRK